MARVRFDEKYVFTELEKVGNAKEITINQHYPAPGYRPGRLSDKWLGIRPA
ncbi:MAG: hypothetical protein Q7J35_14015 [Candidatus Methanoperedens sp.]|nr:hypothetical protein [Candidatus Methanoperedens sp.]